MATLEDLKNTPGVHQQRPEATRGFKLQQT